MKFLLDQDVYALTARFIQALEHDVVTAAEIGCAQEIDAALLRIAQEQGRIFITQDWLFRSKHSASSIHTPVRPC